MDDSLRRDLLKRYGVALALASLALLIRAALPVPEGTTIYQLPIVAVVLSAWFGGRGPGWFAALICGTGILYRFIPPANTFDMTPDYALGFFIFIALCLFLTEFSAGRRRADQELRESEARFRTFVDRATDAFFLLDDQLSVIDANRQACEALGWSREELIGMHPREFDVGLDEASIGRLAQRAAAGEIINVETRHRRKDGTTFPVEIRAGTFRQGFRLFYLALARDISERKLAEGEHREHLRFLESLDRVNRAIQHTNELEQMLGRALDEVFDIFQCDRVVFGRHSGESETATFTRLAKRERPGFVLDLNLGVEVAADEGLTAMSAGLKAARGPVQWVLGAVPPRIARHLERVGVQSVLSMPIVPKTERPDYFYVFTLRQCTYPRVWTPEEERLFLEIGRRLGDATKMFSTLHDLHASERKLEAAQRIARVGWWERDYGTGRVSLSDEACQMFGVQPVDLPQWQERWVSLIHPDDRRKTSEASETALRGGARYDVEYRVVRPDGTVRVVHSQGDVTRDESGRPVRQFGVMQDITESRAKDNALEMVRTELAHVSRLTTLGELTTSIVHEVSQPLGAMVASAAAGARWLAAEPPDIAEARSALNNIAGDGKRAREVIARIRALTKRQVPRMELLDVNRKILEVVALTEREVRSHDIVLQTELDGTLPRIAGDRVQLQQVLLNLVMNAIEAMSDIHDRSRELTIVSGRDGPSAVAVEVRDSGAGLKAECAERVFEAFYTTKAEGIGIGLSISRSIVEAHGGRLSAAPKEPHGAVFRLSLPVAVEAQP